MTVDEAIYVIGSAATAQACGQLSTDEYWRRSRAAIEELLAEERKKAANRAVEWYRRGQIIPAHMESYSIKQLRAAIAPDAPCPETI